MLALIGRTISLPRFTGCHHEVHRWFITLILPVAVAMVGALLQR
jgi:hypothetical protein